MSGADEMLRIEDMLQSCHRIRDHLADLEQRAPINTSVVHDAMMWNLVIIGEAANHLPQDFVDNYPLIPLRDLVGLRHRAVHGYASIDQDTIWSLVADGLPQLVHQLTRLLAELGAAAPEEGADA